MSAQWAAEERRAWYLRLATAASTTAAKVPTPKVKAAYLRLARHLKWEAEHGPEEPHSQDVDNASEDLDRRLTEDWSGKGRGPAS